MRAITKARVWADSVRGGVRSAMTPRVFGPPYGGTGYYGQAYRWEQVLHYRHWAFVAIKAWIREIAGGAPPNIGRLLPKRDGSRKAVRKGFAGPKAHQDFEPYPDEHPLVRVFANPNKPDVAYDLWAWHIMFKLLTGSAHWWVLKNGFGVPVEFWVIPTHWMRLETDGDGNPTSYLIQSPWGIAQRAEYEDVVSFYEHSPLNRYEGAAVTQAIGEWIDTYEANVRARLAQYKNGAIPAFHVMLGEAYSDPDDAFLARFYAKWFARFQGEDRTGKPLITGSDVEIKPLGINPVDMGYDKTEEQIRDMTLAAFSVPPPIVGLAKDMTYGSVRASKESFREYAVDSELTYTGQVLTEKVVKPVDPSGVLWWDPRATGDPEYKLREIESRRAGSSITPNEERALFGDEPYAHGGDDPLLNGAPVPWATGQRDEGIEGAFERALEETKSAGGSEVQDLALNGAQIASLLEIMGQVASGQLPVEGARPLIAASFPNMPESLVESLVGFIPAPQDEQRSLTSSNGHGGGYTVPEPLAKRLSMTLVKGGIPEQVVMVPVNELATQKSEPPVINNEIHVPVTTVVNKITAPKPPPVVVNVPKQEPPNVVVTVPKQTPEVHVHIKQPVSVKKHSEKNPDGSWDTTETYVYG